MGGDSFLVLRRGGVVAHWVLACCWLVFSPRAPCILLAHTINKRETGTLEGMAHLKSAFLRKQKTLTVTMNNVPDRARNITF